MIQIIKKSTPNFNVGRKGQVVPIMIVCHRTCGSFDGAVSWLCNKESKASSHFVVAKDGRVVQLVDIKDTAWCNGTSIDASNSRYYKNSTIDVVRNTKASANDYTVSIEFEGLSNENGELTDVQFTTAVGLIKHIKSEVKRLYDYDIDYTLDEIVGHCHITPKWKPNCPGKDFPFERLVIKLNESEEEYMVEKRDFKVNGEVVKLNAINHKDKNYVEVAELRRLGLIIDYDKVNKTPIINTKN